MGDKVSVALKLNDIFEKNKIFIKYSLKNARFFK